MGEQNNCHIGKGTTIKGKVFSTGDLRVDGLIIGNVDTTGRLFVGHNGKIDGELKTDYTEVDGVLEIKKIDSKTLKLNATASFSGEIEVENLEVEPGAKLNGSINMKSGASSSASASGWDY